MNQNVIRNELRGNVMNVPRNKDVMKVKSFRMSEEDINTLKVYMNAEGVGQTDALRTLLRYGILYYTMQVIDTEEALHNPISAPK